MLSSKQPVSLLQESKTKGPRVLSGAGAGTQALPGGDCAGEEDPRD